MLHVLPLIVFATRTIPAQQQILRLMEFESIPNETILEKNMVVPIFNDLYDARLKIVADGSAGSRKKFQDLLQLARANGKRVSFFLDMTHVARGRNISEVPSEMLRKPLQSLVNSNQKTDSLNFGSSETLAQYSLLNTRFATMADVVEEVVINVSDRADLWSRYDLETRKLSVDKFGIDPIDFDSPLEQPRAERSKFRLDKIDGYIKWLYDREVGAFQSAFSALTKGLESPLNKRLSLVIDANYLDATLVQRIAMASHWQILRPSSLIRGLVIKVSSASQDSEKIIAMHEQAFKDLGLTFDVSLVKVDIGKPDELILSKSKNRRLFFFISR